MSSWNRLLETVHSCFVDELVGRYPEPKPELGMPMRLQGFSLPKSDAVSAIAITLKLEGVRGIALVLAEESFKATPLAEAVFQRIQAETEHRALFPELALLPGCFTAQDLQSRFLSSFSPPMNLSMTIWFPFRTGKGSCWLGVAKEALVC